MKIELKYSGDGAVLEVHGIPAEQAESVSDMLKDLSSYVQHYLQCLEKRFELATEGNAPLYSSVSAQIIKSRASLDDAGQQLALGLAAARGEISATDLGFPEFDRPA